LNNAASIRSIGGSLIIYLTTPREGATNLPRDTAGKCHNRDGGGVARTFMMDRDKSSAG